MTSRKFPLPDSLKRAKNACSRCSTIVTIKNGVAHEKDCKKYWEFLGKEGHKICCSFCEKTFKTASSGIEHLKKQHWIPVENKIRESQPEPDQEGDDWDDFDEDMIEMDNGEKDTTIKNKSLIDTSINVKENILDTSQLPQLGEGRVIELNDDDDELDDIPDLEGDFDSSKKSVKPASNPATVMKLPDEPLCDSDADTDIDGEDIPLARKTSQNLTLKSKQVKIGPKSKQTMTSGPKSKQMMTSGPKSKQAMTSGPKSKQMMTSGPKSKQLKTSGPKSRKRVASNSSLDSYSPTKPSKTSKIDENETKVEYLTRSRRSSKTEENTKHSHKTDVPKIDSDVNLVKKYQMKDLSVQLIRTPDRTKEKKSPIQTEVDFPIEDLDEDIEQTPITKVCKKKIEPMPENSLPKKNKVGGTPDMEILEIGDIEGEDFVQDIIEVKKDSESAEQSVFDFADSHNPVSIKTLHGCKLCSEFFLTKKSTQRHIELYHKIAIPTQKKLNFQIEELKVSDLFKTKQ